MGRKRSVYYIDKDELIKEIKHYKDTDEISEDLGVMLLKIAQRYSSKSNFVGYSYRDEFISDATYRMVGQLDKINLDHPNCQPFSYLTKTCHRCFIAKINKEKKYQNLKLKLTEKYFTEIETGEKIQFKKNNDDEVDDDFYFENDM